MVTQKEIAEKLNVSQSLVARALKGESRVSEITRLRVEELARELGYDAGANTGARSMAMRRHGQTPTTGLVALVFPPLGIVSPQYLPFFMPVLAAADAEARHLGMEICLCPMHLEGLPRLIRERNVDGVFFLGDWEQRVNEIRALRLPVVTFHSQCENAHSVVPDDYRGTKQVTQLLLKQGHRRIAFIGTEHHKGSSGQLRLQGYVDAMAEAGINVPSNWIHATLPGPVTTATAPCYGCDKCAACIGWKKLLEQNPVREAGKLPFTGLVCHNDAIAIATISQLQENGYEVPRDLSVTGYDGISDHFQSNIQLTSVSFPRYEMGKDAIRLLHESINGDTANGEPQLYQHLVFDTHLLLGESTQPLECVSDEPIDTGELAISS